MSEDRLDIAIDILGTEQKKIKDKLSELEEHKTKWVILFKEMYNYEVKKRSKLKKRIESLEERFKQLEKNIKNHDIRWFMHRYANFSHHLTLLKKIKEEIAKRDKRIMSLEGYTGKANLYDEEGRDYISFLIERIMNLESVLKDIYFLMELGFVYPLTKGQFDEWWRLRTEKIKKLEGAGGNLHDIEDVKEQLGAIKSTLGIEPTTDAFPHTTGTEEHNLTDYIGFVDKDSPSLDNIDIMNDTPDRINEVIWQEIRKDAPAEESSIFREFNLLQKAYDDGKKEKEKELIAEFIIDINNIDDDEDYYEQLLDLENKWQKRLEEQEK